MNGTTVIDMRQFVQAKNGQAFTTTQRVAEAFGKQHHHVMQKVAAMECSEQFLTSNFSRVQFEHRGNTYDAFEMTKDGFLFLVMGFTGKKAASIKEGYIAAFNWMAEQLGIGSDRMVGSVLSTTIGTDGFHMLGSLIKGKVSSLPAPVQRRATMKIWSQTHAAFGVRSAADIPAEQLDAARNFIAAYALEGEWIKASNLVSMELKDDEIQSLHIILTQLGHLMGRIGSIERAGSSLGSELLSAVFSHLYEARPHLQELMRKRGDEVRRLYQARFNTKVANVGRVAA